MRWSVGSAAINRGLPMDLLTALLASPTLHLALAGASGGAGRWFYAIIMDKKMLPKQAAATVGLGVILGVFVSPLVVGFASGQLLGWGFQPDPDKMPSFTAFAMGLGGVGLLGAAIDFLKAKLKQPTNALGIEPSPPNTGV